MSHDARHTIVRGVLLVAALILQSACGVDHSRGTTPVMPFKSLFSQIHTTPLNSAAGVGFARQALLINAPIAPLDSGRYVAYDQRRLLLSFRDSLGKMIAEVPVPKGFFTALVALPEERRIVLAGRTSNQNGDTRDVDLHEFDFNGKRVGSYAKTAKAHSELEGRFGRLFATRLGDNIVTGTFNSNRLRLYNRVTQREKWVDVASSWYRPLAYPSHAMLPQTSHESGTTTRMPWMHTQPFMNGVFALTGGRLLVRFQAYTSLEDRAFFYVVTDSSGRSYAISQATHANIVATRGDTAFWVNGGTKSAERLASGVIDLPHLVR